MSWIVAQREIGSGLQEIVSIDLTAGVTGVLARPWEEPGLKPKDPPIRYTPQAPKTLPSGVLMAYRLRQGQQFNLDSASNELVLYDGPAGAPRVLPRPETKAAWGVNPVRWEQHGHAAPTDRGTLIHAALELETLWWLGFVVTRRQWCVVETDLAGKPTGYRVADRAEPSWTGRGLTTIDPSGTGRIVTPTRVFDKATSSVGAKSWGWFDPHLSPDGSRVVWLDVATWLPATSGLIIGDLATGKVTQLVKPTTQMQTDAMWLDNATLLGARYREGRWRLITIDAGSGAAKDVPNTLDCTAVHVAP